MSELTTKDILSIPNSLKVSFELEFIDPNNMNLSWFNDYHFEDAPFNEVYSRYIEHPDAVDISVHKLKRLFDNDREDFFIQVNKLLSTSDNDKYALEEIADEIEKESGIKIGLIMLDCAHPEPEEDTWAIGINDMIVLRSPYLNVVDALKYMTSVMQSLNKSHFLSGSNSFQIYIKNDEVNMQHLNWFKIMSLYDKEHTVEYILSIPEEIRKTKTKELLTRVPEHVVRDSLERILRKIKETSFMFQGTQAVLSLSDNEKYINDIGNSVKWASKAFVLCIVANEKEFHRDIYIEKLRDVLIETKQKSKK